MSTELSAEERINAYDAARWDPRQGARLAPAWNAAVRVLVDGKFHRWNDVVAEMLGGSEVMSSTAANLLYTGIRLGLLERRGEYTRGDRRHAAIETRAVRIADSARELRPDLFGITAGQGE